MNLDCSQKKFLWRFLCLGWPADHFFLSLALFFPFISFGIPSSPIYVSFKSTSEFPPFHSYLSHFFIILLPPVALLIFLSPALSPPLIQPATPSPFISSLSVCIVAIYGQCAQSSISLRQPQTQSQHFLRIEEGGIESCWLCRYKEPQILSVQQPCSIKMSLD